MGGRPARPSLEVADVIRQHREAYVQEHGLTPTERAVLDAIVQCRTAALGGHVDVCRDCGHERPSYNSCHNRHCPKCPAVAQAKWIAGRLERVLPTHYFHVVFTLPAELRGLTAAHPRLMHDLLFRCTGETLLALGRDERRVGGELGVTMVLHTWARDLSFHPHVHCVVTGGALTVEDRWRPARDEYLFPVDVMGKLFGGKMLAALRRAHQRGELAVHDEPGFFAMLAKLHNKTWLTYCKRPFGGPEQVIRYLGQYTHRIAISNHRLVAMDDRNVTFRTKDGKSVTLDGVTFLRGWLQHVLPPGFVKIRHCGLHSAAHATTRLEVARRCLEQDAAAHQQRQRQLREELAKSPPETITPTTCWRDVVRLLTGIDLGVCPACGSRNLLRAPLARAPPPQAARQVA
jgi:hypothetical protein